LAKPRAYRSAVRDAHAEATRERIVDAAYTLLKTTRPVDLSYADVAKAAKVSVRTVYRSFPTPDDLFTAVSNRVLSRALPPGFRMDTIEQGIEAMSANFKMLDEDPALFRVMFAVPTRSRMDPGATFERLFGSQLAKLSAADRKAAYAVLDLLTSPYAWDVMHHNWGLRGERSIRASLVAAHAFLDYLAHKPRALDPETPAPPLARRKS
jgi:AcrR family transcriptional regulator